MYAPTALPSAREAASVSTMTSVISTPMASQWLTCTPGMPSPPPRDSIARSVRVCRIENTSFLAGFGISLPKFFIKMYESPCFLAARVLK